MSTYVSDGNADYVVAEGQGAHVGHHGHSEGHSHHGHGHHGTGHHGHRHHGGRRPHREYGDLARLAAEALGSFLFTLAILLSLIFGIAFGGQVLAANWLAISLTVGVALAAAMAAVGHVTGGGEFNPAITVGKAIAGRLPWRYVPAHIFGQIIGAAAAAGVLWAIFRALVEAFGHSGPGAMLGTTAPGYGAFSPLGEQFGFPWGSALLVEIIFSALFTAVVLGATSRRGRRTGSAPLIVGLTFAALWLMTWPISGGGLNPIRAFASTMLSGDIHHWQQLWLFWVGPLIGAALAGLFYHAFNPGEESGHLSSHGNDTEQIPGGYLMNDVVDPAYVATAAPVVAHEAFAVPASHDAAENLELVREPVEQFAVAEGEVVEDGDPIVFGRDADTVADILQADNEIR